VPSCPNSPPASRECWSPVGLDWDSSSYDRRLQLELRAMGSGFDLFCRADLDEDGVLAVFRTTSEVTPMKLSDASVR